MQYTYSALLNLCVMVYPFTESACEYRDLKEGVRDAGFVAPLKL